MAEEKKIDLLDYLVIILKWKKFLIILAICVFVLSYFSIYFLVDEEFDSYALVLPSAESTIPGLSGIMKDINNLPFGLGGISKSADTDLYITIIYSRTSLEKMIYKFNLMDDYGLKSLDKTVIVLKNKIFADITSENAFEIAVRANSPEKAADMVNYLLEYLNETVINLNVSKSKDNREFIEQRYKEILTNLRIAEDSLQFYQETSGMFEATEQLKLIIGAYTELETGVIEKQLEFSYLQKILPEDSPKLEQFRKKFLSYKNELENLKKYGKDNSIFLAYKSLPLKTKNFLRHYRDVEVFNKLLEFVVPLFEHAKFEEQKNIPILQVVDYGRVPEKKSYPQRILFASIATFIAIIFTLIYLLLSQIFNYSDDQRITMIKKNLSFRKEKQ